LTELAARRQHLVGHQLRPAGESGKLREPAIFITEVGMKIGSTSS